MRDGKAQVKLPVDRVLTNTDDDRDFLKVPTGGAGALGYDRTHPATVWFTHTGLAKYQYQYTVGGRTYLGLFIINVAKPTPPPAAAPGPPKPTPDKEGGD